jgi:hypothetical protein
MRDANLRTEPADRLPDGIWTDFMKRLSARMGLSIVWLQFFGLLAASALAFLASEGLRQWQGAFLFRITMVLAAVGAVVVLLPSVGRRIVISLVILFHFGGILTAVTCVNPSPWLSLQIWTHIYRPYLYFMWLNNAYHFYSPEPGPANLMWFCVEYEPDPDGTKNFRWVLVPDLDGNAEAHNPDGSRIWSGTEYTRRLSLAEYSGTGAVIPPNLLGLFQARLYVGQKDGIPLRDLNELWIDRQYREPNAPSKRWIQTYVRHVAHTFKHQSKPDRKVEGVKFYRVIHQYLLPGQLNDGVDPTNEWTYLAFYCGEFDKDGNMKESSATMGIDGTGRFQANRRDPYLYWLIPLRYIVRHAQGAEFEKADSNIFRFGEIPPPDEKREDKQ